MRRCRTEFLKDNLFFFLLHLCHISLSTMYSVVNESVETSDIQHRRTNTNITCVRFTHVHYSGSDTPFKGVLCKIKGPALSSTWHSVTPCEQRWHLRHHIGNANQTSIFSPVCVYYPRKKRHLSILIEFTEYAPLSAYYLCAYFRSIADKR